MDRTASSGFESITHLLQEQQKLMERLEAENRELRRQLDNLRHGVGIAIVIDGKSLALATESGSPVAKPTQTPALQSLQGLQVGVSADLPHPYSQRQTDQHAATAVNLADSWKQERHSAISDSFVL